MLRTDKTGTNKDAFCEYITQINWPSSYCLEVLNQTLAGILENGLTLILN